MNCIACTMPLETATDIGAHGIEGPVCVHCADANGCVKSCAEIFECGVRFFQSTFPDMDNELAERITRKNMRTLPYWERNTATCLIGDDATDEEFQEILDKLAKR